MNDLHKYLIGTAAGVVLCLLIWGGYSLIFSEKEMTTTSISRMEPDSGVLGTESGRSSDILGNDGSFVSEHDSGELTVEQQERLLAAQAANESLAKQYGGQDGSNDGTGNTYPGVFGDDALALNRGIQEQETERVAGNQKLEEERNKVRGYIVQGKSAAQKNQLGNALTAFEYADKAMPDDKDFEAASYYDIASSLFLLSKTAPDPQTAQTARDKAERYIKKSLAARNNADTRELYSNIIAEHQKAAEAKRQQELLAQQQAEERARKEDQIEQQRRQVIELIGQGKNAVNKRQLNGAISAFDKAAAVMPDNKQFASDSYMEMADAMLNLAQYLSNPSDVWTSLDKAENYIKAALAAQNTSHARNLYAKILDARKEQERLAQARADAQRKQQEQAAKAAAQKKAEEQRKEQERLAQAKAEAQRKQQEQAAKAAAQKKAEEQRKEQERLAQAKAEAQRKQQEQAAAKAAAQKKAEEQRKEQERLAQARAEVENLIAQGTAAAVQRKQLSNATLAFDKASRLMPKDNDFAEKSYRKMADAMFGLAENSMDKQTKTNALKKADEYIKKALAAKNTADSQALAAKIADAQSVLQSQTSPSAKPQTTKQTNAAASRQTQPAVPQKNNAAANKTPQANAAKANTQPTTQTRATAEAAAAKKAQAELPAKKREVAALVQQGKKAAANGKFGEAQSAFNKAAGQMPSGDAVFAAEQYREMADAMQSLSKTSPANKTQALNEASDYIKKSIAAKNDDANAHYVYAQIADTQNDTALAVQELETARRLDPQNAQYNYELGRKYFAQKKYPQARTCFEQAVKSNPQFEAAFFNLGMTHKIMNANDAALTAFSKAAAVKPDYIRAWIEIARMQDKKRNYGEAINNYRKALSLEPSNTSALKEMAQVYSKQKDAKQAERYFKEALTLGDADPVTYYNLAAVQLELGKEAEALQNAQKALAVNDKDARFLYTYGLALEKNNRLREAEDYYTRSVTADGNYSKPRINLGRIQLEAGQFDKAEQHLLAAYKSETSNFEVNMNLGKLYGLKNQYGKAIDYYTNAIKTMPKDIDARQNLAAVYLSAGLKENARDTYQAIIKINPQAWDSYYELGKVYISLDNKTEAKAIFEQLLKQKPNYRNAAEVKKLLANL